MITLIDSGSGREADDRIITDYLFAVDGGSQWIGIETTERDGVETVDCIGLFDERPEIGERGLPWDDCVMMDEHCDD